MFVSEQELPVQVREVDRVKVDNVNVAKSREDKILKQFAANSASAYHQYARLVHRLALIPVVLSHCASSWARA